MLPAYLQRIYYGYRKSARVAIVLRFSFTDKIAASWIASSVKFYFRHSLKAERYHRLISDCDPSVLYTCRGIFRRRDLNFAAALRRKI